MLGSKLFGLVFLLALALNLGSSVLAQKSTPAKATAFSVELDEKALLFSDKRCPSGGSMFKISADGTVDVRVKTSSPSDNVEFRYSVTGGQIVGSGNHVQWNLENYPPGSYGITVTEFERGRQKGESQTTTISLEYLVCRLCECASLEVSASSLLAKVEEIVTFTASVSGGSSVPTYNWTVLDGTIITGQGTPTIEVRINKADLTDFLKATVELGNLNPLCNCPSTASATARVIRP